jgi:class 3 adenylate cyclase
MRGETAMSVGVQLYHLCWLTGRLDSLVEAGERTADAAPWIPAWRAAAAFAHRECGRSDEARTHFEKLAADGFANLPRDGNWILVLALLAFVCEYIDDAERARELYELYQPYEERLVAAVGGNICVGSVHVPLGLLAKTAGKRDDAIRLFERAIEVNREIGSQAFLAYALYELAALLVDHDGPPDVAPTDGAKERAIVLLNETLDVARGDGLRSLLDRALALKLQTQGVASIDATTSIYILSSAVQQEQPDLTSHAAPDGTVTILFSDMEESTEMWERLGDDAAQQVLHIHNRIVRDHLARHGGYEVKSAGDGFMLAFSSARRALSYAVAVQRAFQEHNAVEGVERIRVRMGLHTGEAIRESDDFFGHTVILASRIAGQGSGGEIVVSALIKELTASAGYTFEDGQCVTLKGLAGEHVIHRLAWSEDPTS